MSLSKCGIGLVLFGLMNSAALGQPEMVEVTVTGEGLSEDAALRDALRRALEQGGKNEISSHSHVENFELIRDTIYARAEGIVSDYKILEKGEGAGGTVFVKIAAKVNKSAIATTWGEVQNLRNQLGKPGIIVEIEEFIDDALQDSSILEARIENQLTRAGFQVYAGQHVREIIKRELAEAELNNDTAKCRALNRNFRTEIYITGKAHAHAAGMEQPAGVPVAMYNCDAAIKMYYTESGQLITSPPLPNVRGGARGHSALSPQAGKKALDNAGEQLAGEIIHNAMKHWSTRISAGGDIVLEVSKITYGDTMLIKNMLLGMDPDRITVVSPSFSNAIATFKITAKMTGSDLAEILSTGEWAALINIDDQQGSRIKATWIKAKP